jgi:hypothetical protein
MAGAGGATTTGGGATTGGRISVAGAGGATTTGGRPSAGAGGVSHECVPLSGAQEPGAAPPSDAPIAPPLPPPFVDCEGNWRHRPTIQECPSALPRAEAEPSVGGPDTCDTDADCTDKAHGMCTIRGQVPNKYCVYGCVSDSECADGQVCNCGPVIGECRPASCTSDADCNGFFCASYDGMPGCELTTFACHTAEDECVSNADCNGEICTVSGGKRVCATTSCAIGRPFLVEGSERLADRAYRSDWLEEELAPCVEPLAPEVRARLAEAWTRIGLMEHASIAAFARFSLELLALGAPAHLLDQSAQAMRDETAHARQAFALASAYSGEARGPGALAVDGRLLELELDAITFTTFLEGCIGETAAALEAREAADLARDPVVRAVLERVADEEARHALLAYEFLRWALSRSDAALVRRLEDILEGELARSTRAAEAREADAMAEELVTHGILPEARRCALRVSVLRDVVAPCLAEIARAASAPRRSAASSVTPETAVSPMLGG